MKRFKIFIYIVFFITAILLLPFLGFAQVTPGCDPLDPDCPIDGGISLLIAAGIGLGAKKAYQERKKALVNKS